MSVLSLLSFFVTVLAFSMSFPQYLFLFISFLIAVLSVDLSVNLSISVSIYLSIDR